MSAPLHAAHSWQVSRPARPLTAAHLVITPSSPFASTVTADLGAVLVACYRRARSALHTVLGCDGFMISLAVRWRPGPAAIGEPEAVDSDVAVHVFGRHEGESISPVRAMAVTAAQRRPALSAGDQRSIDDQLRSALADPGAYDVPALPVERRCDGCDGCDGSVLTDQERWRADGVRVIRPRRVLIDPHVLVLPLRHVPSLGDLTGDEVASIAGRLVEVLGQFSDASGSTGLSCFANDGPRAHQETPHVHLHVCGRAADEATSPFVRLLDQLRPPASTGSGAQPCG